jgi:predicted GNAT family acetyltransferase
MEMFIGRVDGRAVGAAMGYRTDNAIGVFGVTVIASARRRGYGTALTCAAMLPESGLPCVLSPSPEGAALYSKLGFSRVGELSIWNDLPRDRNPLFLV